MLSWALDRNSCGEVFGIRFGFKGVHLIIKDESTGVHDSSREGHGDLGLKISVRVIVTLPDTASSDHFDVREPAQILE